MTTLGFAGCLAMVSPACVLQARARVKPAYVVDERPPPPRYRKNIRPRAGYVWVRGHWEWRNDRWTWKGGHWVRDREGYAWEHGHWERRGSRWHWVEGRWEAHGRVARRTSRRRVPVSRRAPRSKPKSGGVVRRDHRDHRYPTEAPPPPRSERPGQRSGYVWIAGRWAWKGGDWKWTPGHWERARSGRKWKSGRWERRGNHYEWVEGTWVEASGGVKVRDHRNNSAPKPKRRGRRVPVRRGGN